ncbi:MAG: hypothetical protein QNJ29_05440 [Rhizobiaceae bacterium]|nr:hypothetical protein [Rhizobiaceae bacterium]
MRRTLILIASLLALSASSLAAESVYTKINLEKSCIFHSEYELGASAYCEGYKGYPVHFSEGDLRQMVRFGHVAKLEDQWESFGQFNRVNDTIEWRIRDKKPYAAILRWFVENSDQNGEITKQSEGQVLVVSTVADHTKPVSCVVGYVDARANKGANELARKLADDKATTFVCGKDKPAFLGKRGQYAGDPSSYFDQ